MTFHEAVNIVDNIKYKPNFRFKLRTTHKDYCDIDAPYILMVVYRIIDAKTGYPETLVYTKAIDPARHTEQTLVSWVRERFIWLEKHEADEYFTYKGKATFYPHKPDGSLNEADFMSLTPYRTIEI